jgi:PBP1b-binding outer membrane lipoprotein LpoB
MKKVLVVIASVMFLLSCSNNGGESGAVNDGFNGAGDTNGGLPDTPKIQRNPNIDTAVGDPRVDTERRDSSSKKQSGK